MEFVFCNMIYGWVDLTLHVSEKHCQNIMLLFLFVDIFSYEFTNDLILFRSIQLTF